MPEFTDFKVVSPSCWTYEHCATLAILKAIGITVNVQAGNEPGDVVVELKGVPAQFAEAIARELQRMADNPAIRPLTDRVVISLSHA
jgi:hypothetical protein